eukprot:6657812-Alexandrium_andersonii.AAC.1
MQRPRGLGSAGMGGCWPLCPQRPPQRSEVVPPLPLQQHRAHYRCVGGHRLFAQCFWAFALAAWALAGHTLPASPR